MDQRHLSASQKDQKAGGELMKEESFFQLCARNSSLRATIPNFQRKFKEEDEGKIRGKKECGKEWKD